MWDVTIGILSGTNQQATVLLWHKSQIILMIITGEMCHKALNPSVTHSAQTGSCALLKTPTKHNCRNRTLEQLTKVVCSDESRFQSHHVEGEVCV